VDPSDPSVPTAVAETMDSRVLVALAAASDQSDPPVQSVHPGRWVPRVDKDRAARWARPDHRDSPGRLDPRVARAGRGSEAQWESAARRVSRGRRALRAWSAALEPPAHLDLLDRRVRLETLGVPDHPDARETLDHPDRSPARLVSKVMSAVTQLRTCTVNIVVVRYI